jgi:hypothetical protein
LFSAMSTFPFRLAKAWRKSPFCAIEIFNPGEPCYLDILLYISTWLQLLGVLRCSKIFVWNGRIIRFLRVYNERKNIQ